LSAWRSASQVQIAADSNSGRPSSTIAGTLPSGETALSGAEPMISRPATLSNGTSSSSRVQRARAERVGGNSNRVIDMMPPR
jgi:hypothetical protein